ncbi:hypothetical protein QYE76_070567 [Lolium multiflorum]|uniref:Ribonuclease H1 N-terminal domain-containing protein n=1 Tax=Lolium multiflorum TaxID=4521 RepID=A0AAD8SIE8_LOLMU|nr:hypothetical protein QYE76_070567 [Lolium multiflorum]
MKIKRERPPNVAVADPYYMRDSQLEQGSRTRTKAVEYHHSFMLRNKEKNTLLLPVFPEDDVLRRVRGRVPGVYEEWEDCKKQVHKFSGNCYKGYTTRHEAVAKWRKHQSNKSKMKTFVVLPLLLTIVAAVLYFICISR